MASVVVRFRAGWAVGNMFEYPVWLVTGLLILVFAVLLVFCGVNVPLDDLPGWMSTAAQGLPVTHAVEAGREVVAGASLGSVAGLLATELAIGVAYLLLGLALLRHFELVARRRATIDLV